MAGSIEVEVVFALPAEQLLATVRLPAGSTVADAIEAAGVEQRFPDRGIAEATVGIWGRPVDRDRQLCAGDRVEVYRPLRIDPRQARRQRARTGSTMAAAGPRANR